MQVSRYRRTLLTGIAGLALSRAASANAWPNRPVTLVSPYNPGGTNDVVARLAADRLQKIFGQAFVVENRPGAAGVLGVQSVVRAKPDGYTLLSANNGALVIQSVLRQPPPYDPPSQLTPLAKLADAMQFIAVNGDLPIRSVSELVAYARKNPGQLNFSSSGVGSFGQFLAELLMQKTGIEMVHVPSKGSAAALTELMANRIQLLIDPGVLSQASDPRVRIIAALSPQRYEAYPQYPSLRESGGPELELMGWFGLLGPTGLPPDVVGQLSSACKSIAADPAVARAFQSNALISAYADHKAFGILVREDLRRYASIQASARIQVNP